MVDNLNKKYESKLIKKYYSLYKIDTLSNVIILKVIVDI
jgi:hypothetical protein